MVLAELFARTAWEDGKFSQAFPFLGGGGERRGKPIQAFVRMDERFIRLRSRVHYPDYVVVQDYTILREVDVLQGLKEGGTVFVNTEKPVSPSDGRKYRWIEIPATRIAMEVTGRPLMNAALLGAFCQRTGEITFSSIEKTILQQFPVDVGHQNVEIAKRAYDFCRKG